MKIALVELFVDLDSKSRETAPRSGSELIREQIWANRDQRTDDVLAAIAEAKSQQAKVVVFPGWTLYGAKPSKKVLDACTGITVVLETFQHVRGSGKRGRTWVIREGECVGDGVVQTFAEARDVLDGGTLSNEATKLAHEIQAWQRTFELQRGKSALLLVCGEINIVGGGGKGDDTWHRPQLVGLDPPLRADHLNQCPIVLNPSHTWMSPNATRAKRKWLSAKGTLVTTANTHSGYWGQRRDKGNGEYVAHWKSAKKTTARAYTKKKAKKPAVTRLDGNDRVSIGYVDVP